MDPLDFLTAAADLQNSCSEAKRRSAVSRGYYAVYHHIVAYLRQYRIFKEREQVTHGNLLQVLEGVGDRLTEQIQYEKLGTKFGGLQRQRSRADYRLSEPGPNERTCVKFVNNCHNTVELFDSCKGNDFLRVAWEHVNRFAQGQPVNPFGSS